jgi:glycosyltransferase involved in cell wall biosynthesis
MGQGKRRRDGDRLISIVLCTYNRAGFLRDALTTLVAAVRASGFDAEILVVNNASTDATDEVVTGLIDEYPDAGILLINEPRQGLSHARNTGINRSRGDVICFLDDDVLIPEVWLSGLLDGFSLGESIGCVAGRIELSWPDVPRPPWLDRRCLRLYGAFSHGERSFVLPCGEDFFGGNVALTREAVEKVGLFDTGLGRKESSLMSGEDTDYSRRLWESGFTIAYSSEGFIYHRVQPERLKIFWVARRAFWAGVTNYFRHGRLLYPFRSLPKLLLNAALLILYGVLLQKNRVVTTCFRLSTAAGPLYAWYLHFKAGRGRTRGMNVAV